MLSEERFYTCLLYTSRARPAGDHRHAAGHGQPDGALLLLVVLEAVFLLQIRRLLLHALQPHKRLGLRERGQPLGDEPLGVVVFGQGDGLLLAVFRRGQPSRVPQPPDRFARRPRRAALQCSNGDN